MKCIVLIIVCFAALVKSHRLDFGKLGNNLGSDMGLELGSDIGTGLDMDTSAVATAEAVANGGGTAVANAKALAQGPGRVNAVAKAVSDSMADMFGPRTQGAASSFERGENFGENMFNNGASGVGSQSFYKRGEKSFYNHEHHHSSVTKIEHAETSDEHDIGGNQAFDEAADKSSAFNKHNKGSSFIGNNFENDAQEVESIA